MFSTTYESISKMLSKTRSANSILYYIESKGWFNTCKRNTTYTIPYIDWVTKTLINKSHIKILNILVNGNGNIEVDANNYVIITSGADYIPKTPADHIIDICKTNCKTSTLCAYLDEFYYSELYNSRREGTCIRFIIEYLEWLELFDISADEIAVLSESVTDGKFYVEYENNQPAYVVITW